MAAPVESLLAMALTLRGANVSILLCDAFLPACSMATLGEIASLTEFIQSGLSHTKCPKCHKKGGSIFGSLGLPIHWYSQLLSPEARQKLATLATATPLAAIPDFRLDGIAAGEHAMAGALRFFAKGDLDGEPHAEAVLRRYFQAALITTFAVRELLGRQAFDCAVFHHGIYVPMGLIGEVARQEGVRVVNWIQAYRKNCFIFSHGDTYHHTLMTEPVDRWEDMPWNAAIEAQLLDYLKSRWQGTKDWIRFHDRPDFDIEAIEAEIGVDFAKPCVGLLTNVIWDAQLHYPANAFGNMLEWVLETIRYFAQRRDLQLLIRVHPAEITGFIPSRQKVVDEIRRAFASLPPNVFVIAPESRVSTYAAMSRCDCVIIYGTKTGVELTSDGHPGHRRRGGLDQKQGDHPGCRFKASLLRHAGPASPGQAAGCGDHPACPEICLSLFLPAHDPACVFRNDRQAAALSTCRQALRRPETRKLPRPGHHLRRHPERR